MTKRLLIEATHPEETRVVVVDGKRLEEFDYETASKRQLKGNIYLAKVTRVEPSLQAAFVDYGGNRHGFLAFSEIHPDYYQIPVADREALLAEQAAMDADNGEFEDARPSRGRDRRPRPTPSGRARTGSPARVSISAAMALRSRSTIWRPRGASCSISAARRTNYTPPSRWRKAACGELSDTASVSNPSAIRVILSP